MSKILCIESSTEVCSVAISENGQLIDCIEDRQGQNHARLLTCFIEQLFDRHNISSSQLSAVAVSQGPGSYTGLRIGVSAAKGLCYASTLPLIAICPLQAMASELIGHPEKYGYQPGSDDRLVPMIDARRMEVYMTILNSELNLLTPVDALIIDENSFRHELEHHRCIFFGNGAGKCRTTLTHPNALFTEEVTASSTGMVRLAFEKYLRNDFVDVAYFEPFYLKDFKATTPRNSVLDF